MKHDDQPGGGQNRLSSSKSFNTTTPEVCATVSSSSMCRPKPMQVMMRTKYEQANVIQELQAKNQ